MIPTPSSSTLSPLAPPFKVDRPISTNPHQQYSFPPPPPHHPPPPPLDADGDGSSSWMDPSLEYTSPPFSKGGVAGNYMAYEDAYGSWCVKQDDSAKLVQMGLESDWQKIEPPTNCGEMGKISCENAESSLHLHGAQIVVDGHTTLKSNSYDKYMAQLASCSTDSIVYYQDCSSSAHVYDAANINNSSAGMSRNEYSSTQHRYLRKVNENYVDYILEKDKGNGFNPYSEDREGYMKGNLEGNLKGSCKTGGSSLIAACSILGNEATTANTKGIKQLNSTNSPTTITRPRISMQISSRIPDQPNCAVDSPCWKGSSLSQKLPFAGVEILDPHPVVKVSEDGDDLVPGKSHLQASVNYVRSLPSLGKGDLTFNENISSLSFTRNLSPNNILYRTDQKFQTTNGLGCEEIGTKRSQISYGEGSKKVSKVLENESRYLSGNVKQSGEGGICVPSAGTIQVGEAGYLEAGPMDRIQDMPSDLYPDNRDHVMNLFASGTDHDEVLELIAYAKPASERTARKDVELLIKAMHSLSEVLLHSHNDVDESKGTEHELVQLVIDNLEAFTRRGKKGFANRSSYFPGHGSHHSQVPVEIIDATKDQSNIESTIHKEKSDCKKCDESENVGDGTDFKRTDDMAQTLGEGLEENVLEDAENPQVMLYKKLWIQAEAALCSMKYEFQLTRLTLEMENSKHKTKAKETTQDSWPVLDAPNCNAGNKASHDTTTHVEGNGDKISSGSPNEAKACEVDDADASIMARLKVLQNRYGSVEEQPRSSECNVGPPGLDDLGFVETDSTIIPER